jgi:hypothetical protein
MLCIKVPAITATLQLDLAECFPEFDDRQAFNAAFFSCQERMSIVHPTRVRAAS